MSLYLPLLAASWRFARRERRVWVYAFFAGTLIGTGFLSAVVQAFDADPVQRAIADAIDPQRGLLQQALALWAHAAANGVGAAIALLAYAALLVSGALAGIGLAVYGGNVVLLRASRMSDNPGTLVPTRSRERFWAAFGVHAVARIITTALLAGWTAVLLRAVTMDVSFPWAAALFVVVTTVLTILHVATPFALASAVLDGASVSAAYREALVLIRDRWLVVTEASLLLSAINLASIAVWIAGSMALAFPFVLLGAIGAANGNPALVTIAIALGIVALVAYLLILSTLFTSFLIAFWTLLFLRCTATGTEPKAWILRIRTSTP